MDNETKIKISFDNKVSGSNLDKYASRLERIYSVLSAMKKGKMEELSNFNITITKTKENTQQLNKDTEKLTKTMSSIFNVGKLVLFTKKVTNLVKTFGNLTNKSAEYIENLNLLEVAYSNVDRKTGEFNEDIKVTSARIENFVKNMANIYGLDESNLARSFGIFKQLANAMELPTETAENLSELMVKMTNDIASLYNLPLNRASNALQSALAGQVRPIRSATGADITEKTLQKTVDSLELDRSISQLSFVEKRLVMVISLTNQLKNSQGDYGRTIESVANQVRVMHEQWDRLSRAIGNVFYPLMKSIMPVVNGVLMALTEIFNIVASLVGFKLDEFDYSGLAGVSDTALDLEENLNGAGKEVDKLKTKLSGLRSFDKLNVISTPKSASSGTGTGSGSIDPKILEAFNKAFADYDDMLGKVRMKATKIRDDIMEWLGFSKEINPLTGEIEWKYQGIGQFLKNIGTTLKNMSPFMKVVTTGLTIFAGSKIINGVKNLGGMLSKITGISKIMPALKSNTELFSKSAIDLWSENLKGTEKFRNALIGAGGLVLSLDAVKDAMKDISTTSEISAGNVIQSFLGITGSAGSLALTLGSYFGTNGVIFGGITGAIMGLMSAWSTYETYANTNLASIEAHGKEIDKLYNELNDSQEYLNEQFKIADAHTNYYETLYEELTSIVDENGKIKQGYEDRAKVITGELASALGIEIKIVDGVIVKYKDLKSEIDKVIKKKEALAKLNALEAEHEEAIKNIGEARKKESQAYDDLEEAQNKYNQRLDEQARKWNISKESLDLYYRTGEKTEEFQRRYNSLLETEKTMLQGSRGSMAKYIGVIKEAEENYKTASDTLDGYNKIILDWKKMTTYATQENYDAMNKYFDHLRYLYGKDIDEQNEYWNTVKTDNQRYLDALERNRGKYDEATYNQLKKSYEEQIALSEYEMKKLKYSLIKDTSEISDDIVNFYYQMGTKSVDEFMTEMEKLPDEVQINIVDKMKDKGMKLTEQLQEGIDKIELKKTIKVDADTTNATKKLQGFFSGDKGLFSKLFNISTNASGGMPPVGQLFIANEQGPELVGHIGGKSFVANQNQMMDLLDKKIGNAQSKPVNATFVIQVGDKEIARQVINDLQDIAKTDGKPITIGG